VPKVQPNNELERTVRHRGPRLAVAQAPWPARSTRSLGVISVRLHVFGRFRVEVLRGSERWVVHSVGGGSHD